jgi:hypothetical protein
VRLLTHEQQAAEQLEAEARLAQVSAKIRRNFPDPRAPLCWRRDSPTRIVSICARFAIESCGEGDAKRYRALALPHAVIGVALASAAAAKEICNRHASPLILET